MLAAFESLLPVFILMGLGFVLRWRGIIPAEMWRGLELLGYWVFFPALLSLTLIRADLASLPLAGIMLTMAATYFTMAGLLILFRGEIMRRLALGGPAFSSIFQSATRWNGFIALPILAKLHGELGVALVAVVMGVLVPVANFCAVYVVAQNADARKLTTFETLYLVFRNPFIWATGIGLLINLAQVPIYDPVMTILNMLGGAAIASGLLMVGAGLQAEKIRQPSQAVWLGTGLKLFATPLFVTGWSFVFGIDGVAFLACIVCAAVPTAMSAYVLARQMGGDAPLVATTVTLQTAISFVSIPAFIFLAQTFR
jgi:malonate transporter and related proteins